MFGLFRSFFQKPTQKHQKKTIAVVFEIMYTENKKAPHFDGVQGGAYGKPLLCCYPTGRPSVNGTLSDERRQLPVLLA